MAMKVTAENVMADWPVYRCATQMKPGEDVMVRTLTAPNDTEMRSLLKRVAQVKSISDFHFCEVHKYDQQSRLSYVVIGNINEMYPTETEVKDTNVYSSGAVVPKEIKPVLALPPPSKDDGDPYLPLHKYETMEA